MNHNISMKKLSRETSHRMAMLRNLTISLVRHKEINTTLSRAKALRPFVERLITLASRKPDLLATRRQLFSRIRDKDTVELLLRVVGPHYANTNGGYTRVIKNGFRSGDCAPMAVIQFVNAEKMLQSNKKDSTSAASTKVKDTKTTKKVQADVTDSPKKKSEKSDAAPVNKSALSAKTKTTATKAKKVSKKKDS